MAAQEGPVDEEDGVLSRWSRRIAGYFNSSKDEEQVSATAASVLATGAPPLVTITEVEVATQQKRVWLDQQDHLGAVEQLASWPSRLIEGFYVVGLPPDTEITQIACDLLESQKTGGRDGSDAPPLRSSAPHLAAPQAHANKPGDAAAPPSPRAPFGPSRLIVSVGGAADARFHSSPRSTEPRPSSPFWHAPDPGSRGSIGGMHDVFDSRGMPQPSLLTPTLSLDALGSANAPLLPRTPTAGAGAGPSTVDNLLNPVAAALSAMPSIQRPSSRGGVPAYDKPPAPSYPASVLFRYPEGGAQGMLDDEQIAALCFPNQVAPRRLRRSPSWSALHAVISHKAQVSPSTAQTFMVKSAPQTMPLYGVCFVVEEPIHRPPTLAQSKWPACSAPYRQCLITAPRAYCLTSHYPFFGLLCQALNVVIGLERLNRSLAFGSELQASSGRCTPSRVLHGNGLPTPAAAAHPPATSTPRSEGQPNGSRVPDSTGAVDGPAVVDAADAQTSHPEGTDATPGAAPGEGLEARVDEAGQADGAESDRVTPNGPHPPAADVGSGDDFGSFVEALPAPPTPAGPTRGPTRLAGAAPARSAFAQHARHTSVASFHTAPDAEQADLEGFPSQPIHDSPTPSIAQQRLPSVPQPGSSLHHPCEEGEHDLEQPGASRSPSEPTPEQEVGGHASGEAWEVIADSALPDASPASGVGQTDGGPGEEVPALESKTVTERQEASSNAVDGLAGVDGPGELAPALPLETAIERRASASTSEVDQDKADGADEQAPETAAAAAVAAERGIGGPQVPPIPPCCPPPPAPRSAADSATSSALSTPAAPDAGSAASEPALPPAGTDNAPAPAAAATTEPAVVQHEAVVSAMDAPSESPGQQFSPLQVIDVLLQASVPTPGDRLAAPVRGLPPLTYCRSLLSRRWPVLAPSTALAAYAEDELAAELAPWSTAVLARLLPTDALLQVLNAALLECSVVFFHPVPSVLSAAVLGVLPMLRPFTWQCPVLPVTPVGAVNILDAPFPFLVGCQYKTQDVAARCNSHVRVNLYKGSVSCAAGLPQMPGQKRLAAALAAAHTRLRAPTSCTKPGGAMGAVSEEQAAAAASMLCDIYAHLAGEPLPGPEQAAMAPLRGTGTSGGMRPLGDAPSLDGPMPSAGSGSLESPASTTGTASRTLGATSWWSFGAPRAGAAGRGAGHAADASGGAGVVGDLRPHVITHLGTDGERTAMLMRESLLGVQPARDRAWVKAFTETQMFEVYSDRVLSTFCESRRRT